MNILIYATTFGADLLSMARYLESRPDVNLRILVDDPDTILREPVFSVWPLKTRLISKSMVRSLSGDSGFRADITIMDNRLPLRRTSPAALMLWHGFGWKGPNDLVEFRWLHRQITSRWGSARKPNNRFIWQCFGPWDFEHRTSVSGFHPGNCRILGAASHDELVNPADRNLLQKGYPFDVTRRKTVLIAPTWHYGEVFSHWNGDEKVMTRLLDTIAERDANAILRLHDSFRFEKKYVRWLRSLEQRYPDLILKFKDQHPDNFMDMQVSDILVTNFSSIANLFYASGKPTIHIYPVRSGDEAFLWRKQTIVGQWVKKIPKASYIWKLPPEDNGGLMAYNEEELISMTSHALENPDCCREKSREFLDRHMLGADGKNRERIWGALNELMASQ